MGRISSTIQNSITSGAAVAPPTPLPSEWLDPVTAGQYLGGIARATLAEYRVKGIGPAYSKVGGFIRYRRADLDAYMEAGRVVPGGR